MKKFLLILSLSFFIFLSAFNLSIAGSPLNAYLFYGEGCPHCEKEINYLETIKEKYPGLEIKTFEIYFNQENLNYLKKIAETLGADSGGVPFLVIGDQYFVGFSEKISPMEIENRIGQCLNNYCSDSVASILGITSEKPEKKDNLIEETKEIEENKLIENIVPEETLDTLVTPEGEKKNSEKLINLPIFGEIDAKDFSLPFLTMILAFLDGFNPCAMWVLLFLVSLLFGIENKKRLWTFGLIFLFSSAVVYFLFMTAWLNLFMFLGFIALVRIIIGIIALLSGYFNLKEYFTNPSGGCKVTGGEKRQKIFEKLKKIIQEKKLIVAIVGLIALAFIVNLVELVCSLGLPAIYVQILSLSDLSVWQYYLYLIFYVFVFILPALIVFSISAITLQLTGISTKYGRIVHLISGIIMLLIGVVMIFKPEWLMFG